MTSITPEASATFLGRDSLMPFIGQVEDVNDPKGAHRVKVRCVGIHPKEKKGDEDQSLKTEDLPWARVGMSTQFAQSARIGAKHGLLPGSWVFGYFLDGQDCQDPLVLCSLTATSKSTGKDQKEDPQEEDGKLGDQDPAFGDFRTDPKHQPHSANRTKEEQSREFSAKADKEGFQPCLMDYNLDAGEQNDGEKPLRSREAEQRQESKGSVYEAAAQAWDILQGDKCDGTYHTKEDAKVRRQQLIPGALYRKKFYDKVWDKTSGKYFNMPGVYRQYAQDMNGDVLECLSSYMNAKNDEKRGEHSEGIEKEVEKKGRDSKPIEDKDKEHKKINDKFNGIMQESLFDQLLGILLGMIKSSDGGGGGGGGQGAGADQGGINQGSGGGTDGDRLTDPGWTPSPVPIDQGADCLAEDFVNNIHVIADSTAQLASEKAKQETQQEMSGGGGGGGGGGAASMIQQALSFMKDEKKFPMEEKHRTHPETHNSEKDKSLSVNNKEKGCRDDRVHNTGIGPQGSGTSGGGGSAGAALSTVRPKQPTGYGSSLVTPNTPEWYGLTDFGGASNYTGEYNTIPCEEAIDPPDEPEGENGVAVPYPFPSMEPVCAENFANGIPNQVVVKRKGRKYFFNNVEDYHLAFPSIFISGYLGTPVPVVDEESGEMVAILVNCKSFGPQPNPNISIIPDRSPIGIKTNDPDYDIQLGGFFIANMGFNYCEPEIEIYDRDKETYSNASAKLFVDDGNIVDYEIINSGTGFRRIPDVKIVDKKCGRQAYGAKLYPIMNVVARKDVQLPEPVQAIYCPSNLNLYF